MEFDLSTNDPFFKYIKPITKRTENKLAKERKLTRPEVFEYYDPKYDWQPGTEIALCKRVRRTLLPDTKQVQFKPFYFTVEPHSFVLQLGELEPFFLQFGIIST